MMFVSAETWSICYKLSHYLHIHKLEEMSYDANVGLIPEIEYSVYYRIGIWRQRAAVSDHQLYFAGPSDAQNIL